MKLVLAETKLIKDSISIISEIVTEARFHVTKDSIQLVAMDPANVAMVIFKLLSSAFVEYDVKQEVNLSINLNDLKQVLRRIKADDSMTLESGQKFKITLKGKNTRVFNLPLIDVDEKEQKIPELNFNAKIATPSTVLADAIEDMDIIGESVAFTVDKKILVINSSSDLSDASFELKADKQTTIEATEKLRSKYSIEYLKKMIQGAKLSDDVKISLSKDYPIQLDYIVVDKVQLSFILAPRVDND